MIPHEQRGYEKVESLKREEIHAHFHKRDEQMRSSLEPPLSGCFPDVGFFFFFFSLSQFCGWGSPSVLQEWPDGGSTPRGAPDAGAGPTSPSSARRAFPPNRSPGLGLYTLAPSTSAALLGDGAVDSRVWGPACPWPL